MPALCASTLTGRLVLSIGPLPTLRLLLLPVDGCARVCVRWRIAGGVSHISAAHTADVIIHTHHITLRTMSLRILRGIASLGVAALRARAMHIQHLSIHNAVCRAERDVHTPRPAAVG